MPLQLLCQEVWPEEIAATALEDSVHVVGLSILSGSHVPLVAEVLARMRELGIGEVPVAVGGIIPPKDARRLETAGVARVYPNDDGRVLNLLLTWAPDLEIRKKFSSKIWPGSLDLRWPSNLAI